uniref:Myosin vIII n=1 Tax=Rhizophora mucronata TaxID=61149 RepID=A0A2P2M4L0_RHIMU
MSPRPENQLSKLRTKTSCARTMRELRGLGRIPHHPRCWLRLLIIYQQNLIPSLLQIFNLGNLFSFLERQKTKQKMKTRQHFFASVVAAALRFSLLFPPFFFLPLSCFSCWVATNSNLRWMFRFWGHIFGFFLFKTA